MTKIHNIIICFLLCFLSSCSYKYYVPTSTNLVNLKYQGDFEASAGIGVNGTNTINGAGTIAYSPLRGLGLMANYSRIKAAPMAPTTMGQTLEGAVGTYFQPFGRKEQWNMDLYAGYGQGHIINQYATLGVSRLDYKKYFGQMAFHVTINKEMAYSTGLRIGRVVYTGGLISDNIPNRDLAFIEIVRELGSLWVIEWSNRIEVGREPFRFFGDFSLSDSFDTRKSFSIPFVMSYGATLNF